VTFRRSSPRAKSRWFVLLGAVAAMTVLIGTTVLASHPVATLSGSNFEIDNDANLLRDDPAPSTDWAELAHGTATDPEKRATDEPTGRDDDSYSGGVKEDTTCPGETTGSIPNNKSDLKTFSVYVEAGSGGHPGFVHLAWSRVTDPSGTTLMDFEFNQSETSCGTGPNKERTSGDLLIEYAIDQGGARANVFKRTWNGSAWGPAQDISLPSTACGGLPCAAGTINSSSLSSTDSDGLGTLSARTFGEASIDLRSIFPDPTCRSFGSAMLKSRSSTSFTSQLKDFISPVGISLTNCGRVVIRKDTGGETSPNFGFTKTFPTDPSTSGTFNLAGGGTATYANVLLSTTSRSVTEGTIPSGWAFDRIDCAVAGRPSSGVTPSIVGSTVSFVIDAPSDVLDCTFYNFRPKANPKASTTPSLIPQDSATVSDLDTTGAVDGAANKQMTFTLHGPTDTTCSGTPVYSKTVTVTANQEYKTDNGGAGTTGGYSITATGTYRWKVVYNGDSRNNGFTVACGAERVTITELVSHTPPAS